MARPQNSGEGSWERLPDGRWLFRIYIDGVRKKFRGHTKQQCRAAADAFRHEGRHGDAPRLHAGLLLADYLPAWVEGRRHELTDSTYRWYRGHVRQNLSPELGRLTIAELERQDVLRVMALMTKRGRAPRTVNGAKVTLGAALQDAIRDGLISQNVARLVKPLRQQRYEAHPLDAHELELIQDALRGTREEPLYTVELAYGLRQGELLGLRWADIDFVGQVLHVRQSLYGPRHDQQQLKLLKTQGSRRDIVMPPVVAEAFYRQRRQQDADRERLAARGYWPEHVPDLVFRTPTGTPLYGPTVTRGFQRLLAELGIERRRFHDLRHSVATYLLLSGVELKLISDILGHASIHVTADIYAHVLPQMQEAALAPMVALLSREQAAS